MSVDSTPNDTSGTRAAREQMTFILCVAALVALGICFIYSACYVSAEWPVRNRWWRQLVWLLPGSVACGVLSRLDYRRLKPFLWAGYGLSLVLLVVVLLWGVRIGGARRWFRIFGLLFQPAESARFLTIAAFAGWVTSPRERLSAALRAAVGVLLATVPLVLIALEPSLGNALTLVPPLFAIVAVERVPARVLRPLLVGAALLAICYIGGLYRVRSLGLRPRAIAEAASPFWPWTHHVRRVAFFASDTGDWNDRQSLLAIAGGGAWGKGFRQGIMKMLGYLPRPVAPTDFIFSVIGEEAGFFLGTVPVLLLYAMLVVTIMRWGEHAPDPFGRALCVGFGILFATHVALNIGMTVRLVPVVGLPLPFLSYGGTFLVCCLAACGLVTSVARQAARKHAADDAGNRDLDSRETPVPFFDLRVTSLDAIEDGRNALPK